MKEPVRVIDGTTEPHARFWQVRNQSESESGEGEIWFYGNISEYSWWGDEVTPALMKYDLDQFKGKDITVRIHSGGGDVFAASAIRAMLMAYPGKVTTRIEGLCASAATYVAMAGDRVMMQDSAFFMIHDPWALVIGGVKELGAAIRMLKTIKNGIVETYQGRTGLEEDELAKMMEAETWMTAQDAKEKGFVDEVITNDLAAEFAQLATKANMAVANALRDFEKVPERLRDWINLKAESERMKNETAEDGDSAPGSAETEVAAGSRADLGEPNEMEGDEPLPYDPTVTESEREKAVKALREKVKNILKEER